MSFYGANDDLNPIEQLLAAADAKFNRGAKLTTEESAAVASKGIPSGYYLDPNGDYAYSWYAPTATIQIVWSKARGHYRKTVEQGSAWAAIVNKVLTPSTRTQLSEGQMKALPDPVRVSTSAPLIPDPADVGGEPEGIVAKVKAFYDENPNALPLTVAGLALVAGAAVLYTTGSGSRSRASFGRTNPRLWE